MPIGEPARLVALDLPPGEAFLRSLNDAWSDGDAVLPLPRGVPGPGRAALLARLRPSVVVDGEGTHQRDDGLPVRAGTALVVVTSGSTGPPKGVLLSHAALEHSARASVARLGATADDRWLCCLPLDHIAGLQIVVRSRLTGSVPIIHSRFNPQAIAAEYEAALVSLVPTMLHRLLECGADLRRFRTILLGGAAPAGDLLDRARDAGANVVTTYGMTETCGGCVYDGVPLDGVEIDIGTEGLIRIRGPVLLDGYRGAPDPPLPDGWFETSDLGRWDGGRLVVEGRADDVIITGGENVVADHVEAALVSHPRVRQVAVVGKEDREWGQRVVAVVVPAAEPPTLEELCAHAAAALPRHALPRELVLRAALPLLRTGKVDRAGVLAQLGSPAPNVGEPGRHDPPGTGAG